MNTPTLIRKTATTFTLIGVFTGAAHASTLIDNFTNPNPFDYSDTVTVGYAFTTPDQAVNVTHLGFWDDGNDGFNSRVDVALYSFTGTLLGQITLPQGTGSIFVEGFRFAALDTSVVLQANTNYVIGGFRQPGDAYSAFATDEGVDFTTAAGFDIIEERASSQFGGEAGLTFPGFVFQQNEALIGPNFKFEPIPEPSSTLLVGLGCLGLAFRRSKN